MSVLSQITLLCFNGVYQKRHRSWRCGHSLLAFSNGLAPVIPGIVQQALSFMDNFSWFSSVLSDLEK